MKIPLLSVLLLGSSLSTMAQDAKPLLQSGDRVVFIGNTLVERARLFGHLETSLQLAAGPEVKGLIFRNLGWSGDSVFGDARSYFGAPAEGRDRLAKNLGEIKPNVVLLWYGTETALSVDQGWTNETANGASQVSGSGLEASKGLFLQGYQSLLDSVRSATGEGVREIVLVSPPPFENLGAPRPDQTANNKNLASIRDGIRELAKKNNARFVDLFAALGGDAFDGQVANPALTEDGVNHGEAGHALVARELVKGLGYPESPLSQRDLPLPLPQTRAGPEREGDPHVRSPHRRAGKEGRSRPRRRLRRNAQELTSSLLTFYLLLFTFYRGDRPHAP